jgi:hypothetical protein
MNVPPAPQKRPIIVALSQGYMFLVLEGKQELDSGWCKESKAKKVEFFNDSPEQQTILGLKGLIGNTD